MPNPRRVVKRKECHEKDFTGRRAKDGGNSQKHCALAAGAVGWERSRSWTGKRNFATERVASMTRFDRLHVYNQMIETGMVPVFYNSDFEIAKNVVAACSAGGAKLIEFTNRGDFAHLVFQQLSQYFAKEDPSVILGVGSIVDAGTAAIYINNGANFVVGPLLNPDVARTCNRRKVPYCPGCGSASEIGQAEELGCEIVKVFPGESVGGPNFVKSVLGPCPWTRIMPTGGVDCTEESLSKWFKAGIVCAGMGSNLITSDLVKARDYAGIQKKVADTLALIKKIRGR